MNRDRENSIWLAIQFLFSIIISFITLKINLIQFGDKEFGLWILLISFWSLGTILDLGFGTAIVKYTALAVRKNDEVELNNVISTGSIFFILLGILLVSLGNIAGNIIYFSNSKIFDKNLIDKFQKVFLILSVSFYVQYIIIYLKSIFEGMNQFKIVSKLGIVTNLLILIFVILIYLIKLDIIYLAFAYLTAYLILFLSYILIIASHYNFIKIRPSNFSFYYLKKMISYSFNIQIAFFLGALIDPLIKYLIANFNNSSTVSYYEIARRFAMAISGLFNNSFKNLLPKASSLRNNQEFNTFLKNDVKKVVSFSIFFSGLIFGILSLPISLIIKLWFGYQESILIFFILSLAEVVNNFGFALYTFFMGIGKGVYLILIQTSNVLFIIAFLSLGFLLFQSSLGLIGYFLSVFLMNVLMIYFLKREVAISIKSYLSEINLGKLLILLLSTLILVILSSSFEINIYILASVLSIISVVIFYCDFKQYFFELKTMLLTLKSNRKL